MKKKIIIGFFEVVENKGWYKSFQPMFVVMALLCLTTLVIGTYPFSAIKPISFLTAQALEPSGPQMDHTPQAKLVYNGQKYDMSPFVLVDQGLLNKIQFPSLPDSTPNLTVQQGNVISFQFSKQPTKVDAFIVDYDGDIPSVHVLKRVGTNAFEVSGSSGIWDIEVHAIFASGQYTSFTTLANVVNSNNSNNNVSGQSNSPLPPCGTQNTLQIAELTANNDGKKNNLAATALDNNNLNTSWSASGKRAWIQMDMGQVKSICNIEIAFGNGEQKVNFFTIQASTDGTHFTDIGSAQSTAVTTGKTLYSFPDLPVQARYIRITDLENTQATSSDIKELAVNGQ